MSKYEQTAFTLKQLNSNNNKKNPLIKRFLETDRLNTESVSSIMCYEELRKYINYNIINPHLICGQNSIIYKELYSCAKLLRAVAGAHGGE